jgi:hypothetical protein
MPLEIVGQVVTFNKNIQDILVEKYRETIEAVKDFINQKIEKEKRYEIERAERKARFLKWKRVRVMKYISPNESEGYLDAIYKNTVSGEEIRMISEDIFDYGCSSYPQRLKGCLSDGLDWTEAEKQLQNWLYEFEPSYREFINFTGIRM